MLNPATSMTSEVLSWKVFDAIPSPTVDHTRHDMGLAFLRRRVTPPSFAVLPIPQPETTTMTRLGHVKDGVATDSIIKYPNPLDIMWSTSDPLYYRSIAVMESGDSGGGNFAIVHGGQTHKIIAVNTFVGDGAARVDEAGPAQWLRQHVNCRKADGNPTTCAATSGCSYYVSNQTCWPTGTPNDIAIPRELCAQFNGNPSGCGTLPSTCAYYRCNNTCQPRGTPNPEACLDCRQFDDDLADCDSHSNVCAYYHCTDSCFLRGTPNSTACFNCRVFDGNLASCNANSSTCAYYSCDDTCRLRGTPLSHVCGGGGG